MVRARTRGAGGRPLSAWGWEALSHSWCGASQGGYAYDDEEGEDGAVDAEAEARSGRDQRRPRGGGSAVYVHHRYD